MRRLVSADDRLNVTGLFYAVVSVPQNPVSWKQKPTLAETCSNGARWSKLLRKDITYEELRAR